MGGLGALIAGAALLGAVPTSSTATTATAAVEAQESSWLDDWVLLPIVFYTPETSLGFGGMVVYTFDAPGNSAGGTGRRSNLLFRAFYTLEKQTALYLEPNVWMAEDLVGITGWFEWRNYPFHFYGIGNDPDLDVFDLYTESVFEATPQVTLRVHEGLRAGLNLHLLGGTLKDYPSDGLLVAQGARGLDDLFLFGFGPTLSWDDRDSNFWPTAGSLVNLDLTIFNEALGSDFSFTRFTADLRTYKKLWKDHVLALQGYLRLSDGEVPFIMLPNLGGVRRHRGWYFGSLRDQHVYLAQLEYRAPIWWRFGLTAFVSAGQAVPQLDDISLQDIRAAVGGGLRFRLNDEGVNIRVDFAYGGRFEFYFQVGEAF